MTTTTDTIEPLTLAEIRAAAQRLQGQITTTPVHRLHTPEVAGELGEATTAILKLELLQHTGTFKARGALLNMMMLDAARLAYGVTAVSAGNHAVAVAFAAAQMGVSAKVVMMASANALRVALCESYGAQIVFAPDARSAFELVSAIAVQEHRALIHPFEGRTTALATATIGLEICEQAGNLDAVIVPIGGGGLCAGIASAVKLLQPQCQIFGVEPEGAASMHLSFAAGEPRAIDEVSTIADSLGAPYALPISFELCRRNVDELVLVSDEELRSAMGFLLRNAKLAVEPAGAAATAALRGKFARALARQARRRDRLRQQYRRPDVCRTDFADEYRSTCGRSGACTNLTRHMRRPDGSTLKSTTVSDRTSLPIGIFDSGVGGLTVLRSLREQLPQESFIYLGDTARLPYGTKSADSVVRYSLQAAQFLLGRGIKYLVIACNTASAVAVRGAASSSSRHCRCWVSSSPARSLAALPHARDGSPSLPPRVPSMAAPISAPSRQCVPTPGS